jgi:uncharacterized peroxidase-related enzyme
MSWSREVAMAWIKVVDDKSADEQLARTYKGMVDPVYGRVDNIMQIHSLHPEGMEAHWQLYREVMTGNRTLPKVDRELVALVVSLLNDCHYWIVHHRRGLRRLLRDDSLAEHIEADYETAGLDERRLSMLRYVEKLTRTPGKTTKEDVEQLRRVGFSDEDILQIAEVTAYYAYVNRIADGLGVELESWIPANHP